MANKGDEYEKPWAEFLESLPLSPEEKLRRIQAALDNLPWKSRLLLWWDILLYKLFGHNPRAPKRRGNWKRMIRIAANAGSCIIGVRGPESKITQCGAAGCVCAGNRYLTRPASSAP